MNHTSSSINEFTANLTLLEFEEINEQRLLKMERLRELAHRYHSYLRSPHVQGDLSSFPEVKELRFQVKELLGADKVYSIRTENVTYLYNGQRQNLSLYPERVSLDWSPIGIPADILERISAFRKKKYNLD
jgi:hypothetical protein